MHFAIIEIKDAPIKKDERMSDCELYDDTTLQYFSDYFGDVYSEKERKDFIKQGRIVGIMSGLGKINARSGSIRLFDEATIRQTLELQVVHDMDEIRKKGGAIKPDDLRYVGEYWRGYNDMFHFEGGCRCSGSFVSDLTWYAGKTLYIGNIFDAHI